MILNDVGQFEIGGNYGHLVGRLAGVVQSVFVGAAE
jgi:hypothetical protein